MKSVPLLLAFVFENKHVMPREEVWEKPLAGCDRHFSHQHETKISLGCFPVFTMYGAEARVSVEVEQANEKTLEEVVSRLPGPASFPQTCPFLHIWAGSAPPQVLQPAWVIRSGWVRWVNTSQHCCLSGATSNHWDPASLHYAAFLVWGLSPPCFVGNLSSLHIPWGLGVCLGVTTGPSLLSLSHPPARIRH